MKACESYRKGYRYSVFDEARYEQGYCIATKEQQYCSCGGDESKCDFYSYIRERAINNVIENTNNAIENEYLTRQEIVNIVNKTACACGKRVPEEFYKALYERR